PIYPIHVELSLHRLLLGEVPDGEVLVADHQADLALASVATHPPAKVSELGKIPGVFDVGRCRIAMHDDRLILHQCTTSFIVAPDASLGFCFRYQLAYDVPDATVAFALRRSDGDQIYTALVRRRTQIDAAFG